MRPERRLSSIGVRCRRKGSPPGGRSMTTFVIYSDPTLVASTGESESPVEEAPVYGPQFRESDL